ncbi:MAG TPA: DEAD/DEAH box helicase [Nitrospira sp.]|nr:DEAD/DEAH box helicase [Nitrospira sp.]
MNQALRWSAENLRKAKARLGVTSFRAGQKELIDAVMEGRDALGILPTGGEQSLCYQLPALFLPHAVVVVSPLISLMKDQQDKMETARSRWRNSTARSRPATNGKP